MQTPDPTEEPQSKPDEIATTTEEVMKVIEEFKDKPTTGSIMLGRKFFSYSQQKPKWYRRVQRA